MEMVFETLEELRDALAYKISELKQGQRIAIDRDVLIEIHDCVNRHCKP